MLLDTMTIKVQTLLVTKLAFIWNRIEITRWSIINTTFVIYFFATSILFQLEMASSFNSIFFLSINWRLFLNSAFVNWFPKYAGFFTSVISDFDFLSFTIHYIAMAFFQRCIQWLTFIRTLFISFNFDFLLFLFNLVKPVFF